MRALFFVRGEAIVVATRRVLMTPIHAAGALALAASLLLPATEMMGQGMLSIDGTATYRERMALPPDAVFEATLEDVSRADAPASVVGQARVEQPGNPPFHFSIQYDPTQIVPNHIYAVRARVTEGGRLLFNTDQRYQVLTQGHGSEIGILMLRRVADAPGGARATAVPLRETYWRLTHLGEKQMTPADEQQEAHLILSTEGGRVTGSGGCNRLMGSYTLNGDGLRFSGVASTRMACMRGMETEAGFLAALEQARTWRISGRQLELFDEGGRLLLRFMAQAMKTK
jgi:putative lipoprotein